MKINIISIYFPPEIGAAPSRILTMAKGLKEKGCDVEIITALANYPTGKIFPKYKNKFSINESIQGIDTKRYWLYPSNSKNIFIRLFSMLSFAFSIWFSLRHLLKRKPELVIIQSPPLFVGLSGIFLAKIIGAKKILNISDLYPLTAYEMGVMKKGFMYSLMERIERYMYNTSDLILGQTEGIVDYIKNKADNQQVELYRNLGKNSPFISESPSFIREKIKIVYAGMLGIAQGVYSICQEVDFKKIGVEFHIYGQGFDKENINKYITDYPDCNIYLHEVIPKEAVPKMLSQYHATIIPLIEYIPVAFPSKILMAISSAIPILFSGEGEGADAVEKYALGWTSKIKDYNQLEKNIRNLTLLQKKEYLEIRQNCIRACNEDFNFDKQMDKIYHLLANLQSTPNGKLVHYDK